MRRNSFTYCGYVCILGVFGAFFRWLQDTTAFEEGTNLAVPMSMWSIVMGAWLILMAVGLLAAARRLDQGRCPASFQEAFKGRALVLNVASLVCLAALAGGGALFALRRLSERNYLDLILGGTAVIAGICLCLALRSPVGGKGDSRGKLLVPVVLYLCYLLIWEYKTYASDPVIWHFGVKILATAVTLIAYFDLLGFAYNKIKLRSTVYYSLLGVAMTLSTFADSENMLVHLMNLGLVVGLVVFNFMLLDNMKPAEDKSRQ